MHRLILTLSEVELIIEALKIRDAIYNVILGEANYHVAKKVIDHIEEQLPAAQMPMFVQPEK